MSELTDLASEQRRQRKVSSWSSLIGQGINNMLNQSPAYGTVKDLSSLVLGSKATDTAENYVVGGGLRIGGAVGGSVLGSVYGGPGLGTVAGGAVGGGLGDLAAQSFEEAKGVRTDFSPGSLAANTAMGAIPLVRGPGALYEGGLKGWAGLAALRGAEGAATGIGAGAIQRGIDTGDWMPTGEEAAWDAGIGGVIGAAIGTPLTRWSPPHPFSQNFEFNLGSTDYSNLSPEAFGIGQMMGKIDPNLPPMARRMAARRGAVDLGGEGPVERTSDKMQDMSGAEYSSEKLNARGAILNIPDYLDKVSKKLAGHEFLKKSRIPQSEIKAAISAREGDISAAMHDLAMPQAEIAKVANFFDKQARKLSVPKSLPEVNPEDLIQRIMKAGVPGDNPEKPGMRLSAKDHLAGVVALSELKALAIKLGVPKAARMGYDDLYEAIISHPNFGKEVEATKVPEPTTLEKQKAEIENIDQMMNEFGIADVEPPKKAVAPEESAVPEEIPEEPKPAKSKDNGLEETNAKIDEVFDELEGPVNNDVFSASADEARNIEGMNEGMKAPSPKPQGRDIPFGSKGQPISRPGKSLVPVSQKGTSVVPKNIGTPTQAPQTGTSLVPVPGKPRTKLPSGPNKYQRSVNVDEAKDWRFKSWWALVGSQAGELRHLLHVKGRSSSEFYELIQTARTKASNAVGKLSEKWKVHEATKAVSDDPEAYRQLTATTNKHPVTGKQLDHGLFTAVHNAVEGWPADITNPNAQKYVDTLNGVMEDTLAYGADRGMYMLTEEGIVKLSDIQAARAKDPAAAGKLVRNYNPDLARALSENPEGGMSIAFAESIVEANKFEQPKLKVEDVLDLLNPHQGKGATTLDPMVAFELHRNFKYVPDKFRYGERWIEAFATNPLPQYGDGGLIHNVLGNQISRAEWAESFGQVFHEGLVQDYITKNPNVQTDELPFDRLPGIAKGILEEIRADPTEYTTAKVWKKLGRPFFKKLSKGFSDLVDGKLGHDEIRDLGFTTKAMYEIDLRMAPEVIKEEDAAIEMLKRSIASFHGVEDAKGVKLGYLANLKWLKPDSAAAVTLRMGRDALNAGMLSGVGFLQPTQLLTSTLNVTDPMTMAKAALKTFGGMLKLTNVEISDARFDKLMGSMVRTQSLWQKQFPEGARGIEARFKNALRRWNPFGRFAQKMMHANDLVLANAALIDVHKFIEHPNLIDQATKELWYEMGITSETISKMSKGGLASAADEVVEELEGEFTRAYVRHTQFTHRGKFEKSRFENDKLLNGTIFAFMSYGRQMSSRHLMAMQRAGRAMSRDGALSLPAARIFASSIFGAGLGGAMGIVIRDVLARRDITKKDKMDFLDAIGKEVIYGPVAMGMDALTARYSTPARDKEGRLYYARSARGTAMGTMPYLSAITDLSDSVYNEGIGGAADFAFQRAPAAKSITKYTLGRIPHFGSAPRNESKSSLAELIEKQKKARRREEIIPPFSRRRAL